MQIKSLPKYQALSYAWPPEMCPLCSTICTALVLVFIIISGNQFHYYYKVSTLMLDKHCTSFAGTQQGLLLAQQDILIVLGFL